MKLHMVLHDVIFNMTAGFEVEAFGFSQENL
jgi:hypothetical protein